MTGSFAIVLAMAMQGAPVPDETDIVVVGRRLATLSVAVGRDGFGRFTCALSQPSGSARLDDQLCRAAATCVKKGASDRDAVSACIDRRKPGLLADLRRARAARVGQ